MRLLGPVRPLVVIKGLGAEEFAVEDFRFAVNVVFDGLLTSCIVARFVHREGVVFDIVLAIWLTGWHESLLVLLSDGFSELVSNDVPVTDLLADRRVMDQSTFNRDRLVVGVLVGEHSLLVLEELTVAPANQTSRIVRHQLTRAVSRRTRRTKYAIIHVLQVVIRLLLALHDFTGRVATNNKLVRGDAMVVRSIRGGPTSEG